MIELVRLEAFQAVFPVTDSSVIPLQENAAKLGHLAGRFALLNDKAYQVTHDKQLTRDTASILDIPVAEGIVTQEAADAKEFARRHGFPIVVKPLSSYSKVNLAVRQNVQMLRNPDEIDGAFASRQQAFVIERFFGGKGCGISFLANDGQLLFAFQHERLHEPLNGGGSTYRKSAALHPDLYANCRKIIEALEYTGVGMIEFKMDPQTDRFILVEINGRFWGSLPLAIAAGADFPAWLYAMVWQGQRHFEAGYRVPCYCRNLPMDGLWFIHNLRADKSDPTLMTRSLHSVLAESRNLILGRESWDSWALDDPKPFFAEFGRLLGR